MAILREPEKGAGTVSGRVNSGWIPEHSGVDPRAEARSSAGDTHQDMAYTAEIRRVGGSLYKAARGSSNLFLPDTCFLNPARPRP